MSSRQEIVDAITAFYQEVIRQPYLADRALRIPPASGWDNLDVEALKNLGKTDGVIDLLRHLPYLEARGEYEKVLIGNDTTPVSYLKCSQSVMDEVNPLPGDCVYLTSGVDGGGYSLILDTRKGPCANGSLCGRDIY
jgi:hypothetical protein